MNTQRRPTLRQLEADCAAWNAQYPEGTDIDYEKIIGGSKVRTQTRSEAQVLSGHTAVVWIKGVAGCVSLRHCTPVVATAAPA